MKNRQAGQAESWFGGPGAGRRKRGPYQGAWKIGSDNMRCRIKTGKTQAEFAALCGISERTLRTWESSGNISTRVGHTILGGLDACGVNWRSGGTEAGYRRHITCRAA